MKRLSKVLIAGGMVGKQNVPVSEKPRLPDDSLRRRFARAHLRDSDSPGIRMDWIHEQDTWLSLRESARGILISSGVAIIGLIPAAFSHGIGSETAKPFAVMILGGLTSSLVLSLVVLPAFVESLKENRKSKS